MVSRLRAPAALLAGAVSLWLWAVLTVGSLALLCVRPLFNVLWSLLKPTGIPSALGYFATEHRSWLVIFVVAPMSLVFDAVLRFRAWYVQTFFSAPELHNERVADIAAQVNAWRARNDGTKLCTARPGWESISPGYRTYKSTSTRIRVDLRDILDLDLKAMTVRCEPMVNMGQISHFLVAKGLTLPLVPEMDDLTVGGLSMGVGIEGSSHKYGLFDDTVVAYEVVLADGRVVTASREENEDLFRALPWSYGTLGFLVSVTLRVVPCKPFVRLTSYPCHTHDDGVRLFSEKVTAAAPSDFVESLAYSITQSVVMTGDMVDASEVDRSKLNSIGWWFKPWFYKHVETALQSDAPRVEYIPLREYFHRHTKSIFWELEQMCPLGNHPVFRWLFGMIMPPKVSFLKLTQTQTLQEMYEKQHVIQDMLVPLSEMSSTLRVFHQHYNLYPLWICPHRHYDKEGYFLRRPLNPEFEDARHGRYEMYVDLGAYGIPRKVLDKQPFDIVHENRAVEDFVHSVHGFQMLYADTYRTREEFRAMFDHSHLDAMRERYGGAAAAFPEVFEKVRKRGFSLEAYRASKEKDKRA
jgi:delta24-sterol reductase